MTNILPFKGNSKQEEMIKFRSSCIQNVLDNFEKRISLHYSLTTDDKKILGDMLLGILENYSGFSTQRTQLWKKLENYYKNILGK